MPGALLHVGATVQCAHAGQAKPTKPNPRVSVGGQNTATTDAPYSVSGCGLPSNAGGPCVTGQWTVGTTRVTSMGLALVIATGVSTCTPTGTPLTVVQSQKRVIAT